MRHCLTLPRNGSDLPSRRHHLARPFPRCQTQARDSQLHVATAHACGLRTCAVSGEGGEGVACACAESGGGSWRPGGVGVGSRGESSGGAERGGGAPSARPGPGRGAAGRPVSGAWAGGEEGSEVKGQTCSSACRLGTVGRGRRGPGLPASELPPGPRPALGLTGAWRKEP